VSTVESQIDALYALPLPQFTAARNALAKSLKGDDAASVKRLEKPVTVAWAVNQLYWHERRVYDRLMASGDTVRRAQLATLSGTSADVRAPSAAHREAVTAAVSAATQLAETHDVRPPAEPLTRMLEALSLATTPPTQPGRFIDVIQPAGLEALTGLASLLNASSKPPASAPRGVTRTAPDAAAREAARTQHAAAQTAAENARRVAAAQLERAADTETRAQALVDLTQQQLLNATASLREAQVAASRAREALARAEAALAELATSRRTP
jgi:hypothetical protein